MMCTAAVCPVSPPQHYIRFDEKDTSLTEESLAHYGKKWRNTNTSERLANFMLNLSPIRDRYGIMYRSPVLNIPFQNSPKREKIAKFDIICNLPFEISLNIFDRLNEQDLCRVCLVSKRWFSIAQDIPLRRRRQAYIRSQRCHYQQSKENYRGTLYTPPHTAAARITSSPALYSLNHRHSPTGTQIPNYYVSSFDTNSTPHSISSVLDSVEKLSIHSNDVRRCLFPGLESPGMKRPNCKDNLIGPSPRRHEGQTPVHHVISKKSKARLRRL